MHTFTFPSPIPAKMQVRSIVTDDPNQMSRDTITFFRFSPDSSAIRGIAIAVFLSSRRDFRAEDRRRFRRMLPSVLVYLVPSFHNKRSTFSPFPLDYVTSRNIVARGKHSAGRNEKTEESRRNEIASLRTYLHSPAAIVILLL